MPRPHSLARHLRPLLAALALLLTAAPAQALPPLSSNTYINERLVAAQVGDLIRRTCPSISARLITAYREMKKLEAYAKRLGYSDAQIKAFINDKDEKARVKAEARAYMHAKGVVEGDRESYCRLGREEIAAGTITGSLLASR